MTRIAVVTLVAGVLFVAAWLGTAFDVLEQAMVAWILAWSWAANIVLGCAVLVMISHVAPIRWFTALRRPMTGVACTIPLLALLFVPIALTLPETYLWVGLPAPEMSHHHQEMLARKEPWLNTGSWILRSVVYFTIWSGFVLTLRHLDRRQDDGAIERAYVVSAIGLPVFGLTWTAASIDWWMSLDPLWASTIFGIWRFAGGMVGAICVAVLVARSLERSGGLPPIPPDVYHALGRLLLAFVVLWAYTTYDQMMLQWIAALPLEVRYWIPRLEGRWYGLLWVIGLGHFALPFALLLSRRFKRSKGGMAGLAVWLLTMRFLDDAYLVVPFFEPLGPYLDWPYLFALLGVGGIVVPVAAVLAAERVPWPWTRWTLEYHSP